MPAACCAAYRRHRPTPHAFRPRERSVRRVSYRPGVALPELSPRRLQPHRRLARPDDLARSIGPDDLDECLPVARREPDRAWQRRRRRGIPAPSLGVLHVDHRGSVRLRQVDRTVGGVADEDDSPRGPSEASGVERIHDLELARVSEPVGNGLRRVERVPTLSSRCPMPAEAM